jgi:hypothetical protein
MDATVKQALFQKKCRCYIAAIRLTASLQTQKVQRGESLRNDSLDVMSGWALLLGGVVGVVTHVLHPDEPKNAEQIRHYIQHTPAAHVGVGLGVLLMLLGLPSLYARLSRSREGVTGGLTLMSLPLIFFGLALADGMHSPLEFGALPAIYRVVPDRTGEI